MCGRFSLATSKQKLQQELPFLENFETLKVSYNIAPTQYAYVVSNDQPQKLQYMSWGLIPNWAKDKSIAGKLINARAEGIETKSSFRVPVRSKRCVVPADSFYEWRNEGRIKVPYRITLSDNSLMMFAGIWDIWFEGNFSHRTFSIITTEPNQEMKHIHNRMPVILTNFEQIEKWLAGTDLKDNLLLLKTPPDGILSIYPISSLVNKVTNNSPEIHLEMPLPPSLF
jgi:putative SOS response-associated peptidase YedK